MPCPKDSERVDNTGRAHAGSQRQIQACVNEGESELNQAIADTLAGRLKAESIIWVSPLKENNYDEYRDEEFLEQLGLTQHVPSRKEFWPSGGLCWDALASIGGGGCILVEAKSHLTEIYGGSSDARGKS